MQAFTGCKDYNEYLNVVKESIKNGIKYYDINKDGIKYLENIQDIKEKSKIIKIMNLIDENFSFKGKKDNEMNKKINYVLSLGIFSNKYKKYFDELTPNSIYTLIIGEFSSFNNYNIKYLNIYLDEKLLSLIYNKNEFWFDIQDNFFMINSHFDKLENKTDIESFRNNMIDKLLTDTLHDGVMNMQEYWNSDSMENVRNVVRGVK